MVRPLEKGTTRAARRVRMRMRKLRNKNKRETKLTGNGERGDQATHTQNGDPKRAANASVRGACQLQP